MSAGSSRCTSCGQMAPTIVRGLETRCVACGALRFPLDSVPVNLAGRPAKVGGSVARVLGWILLAGGLGGAAIVAAILQAIFPAGVAGWIVGGVIATFAVTVALMLLVGGKKLQVAGSERERDAALTAVTALAARRGGRVTAQEVGRALGIPEERADEMLTELAKQPSARVRLEVDDGGQLFYYVDAPARLRQRVASPGVRIDGSPAAASVQEDDAVDELDDVRISPPRPQRRV